MRIVVHYRPEIDGLRAVAVLPVILFHAGFAGFRGGFVGVDVFFVISGYLITTIITAEMAQQKFTVLGFYERRARRILPALFVVLAACIPCALLWLLPAELRSFSKSVRDVVLFVSNFSLSRQVGYFDTAAELNPLLHTWSLAVEEQFYLLFPWLLVVQSRRVGLVLAVAAIASFGVAEWGARSGGGAMYFLPQGRLWELALGALVALWRGRSQVQRSSLHTELGAAAGAFLIAGSVMLYDEDTPFPGVYALVPTAGTALIILFAGRGTWVGRLLAHRLLVGLGLISYSAYLWHQPVFAFAKQCSTGVPSDAMLLVMSVATLGLAYVTWRFVETPFRDKSRVTGKGIVYVAAAGALGFIALALIGSATRGLEQRAKWRPLAVEMQVKAQRGSGERYCRTHALQSDLGPLVCIIGDPRRAPEGVLWGDSFAGALLHGMNRELLSVGRSYYAVLAAGCVPIEGAWRIAESQYACFEERSRQFVAAVLGMREVEHIVWIGAFANLTGLAGQDYVETDYRIDGEPATADLAKRRMLETLRKLASAGKTVVLVGDTPRFPYDTVDYAMKKYFAGGGDRSLGVQRVARAQASRQLNLADILESARTYARVVDGLTVFCDRDWCSSHDAQGRLLFADRQHLSILGSERLAREVMRQMGAAMEGAVEQ